MAKNAAAKDALNRFKMETANEVGVILSRAITAILPLSRLVLSADRWLKR